MNLLNFGKQKMPSAINDPFSKNQITAIRVHFSKSWFGDEWNAIGTVEFKNGNTKGQQDFKGESFDDVVSQIKALIANI